MVQSSDKEGVCGDAGRSASERAYQAIRDKIADGELPGGHRLKEAELVKLCAVSRTPVREALRRLESEGIVTITPNAGAIVATWSASELADLFAVRAQIEGMAAAYAAQRRTAEDLDRLDALAAAFRASVEAPDGAPDFDAITRLNSDFHHAILDVARSRALSAAAAQVMEAPIMLRTFRRYDRGGLDRSAAQHVEIAQAIRVGDAEWARAVMQAHIRAGYQALMAQAGQS